MESKENANSIGQLLSRQTSLTLDAAAKGPRVAMVPSHLAHLVEISRVAVDSGLEGCLWTEDSFIFPDAPSHLADMKNLSMPRLLF